VSWLASGGHFFADRRYDAVMHVFLTVILVLAMIGVLIALGVGVATMLKGGNPRRSNKLMQMRVIMQAVALIVLAILMMMASNR
jgi:ABC-type Na+ efflux pump permease subunit